MPVISPQRMNSRFSSTGDSGIRPSALLLCTELLVIDLLGLEGTRAGLRAPRVMSFGIVFSLRRSIAGYEFL